MVRRSAESAEAQEQAAALLASGADMAQVQELFRDLRFSLIGAVSITRQLLDSRSLAEAVEIVLTSPARIGQVRERDRFLVELEQVSAIGQAVGESGRPALVAIDGHDDISSDLAMGVASVMDDVGVVPTRDYRCPDGLDLDWVRLRDEVLAPARTRSDIITLVHGMFLLRPELVPHFHCRVHFDQRAMSAVEREYQRTVRRQAIASLIITGS